MHIPGYQPICSNQDDLGIFSQFKDTPGGILRFLFTMQLGHSVDGIISLEKNLKFYSQVHLRILVWGPYQFKNPDSNLNFWGIPWQDETRILKKQAASESFNEGIRPKLNYLFEMNSW